MQGTDQMNAQPSTPQEGFSGLTTDVPTRRPLPQSATLTPLSSLGQTFHVVGTTLVVLIFFPSTSNQCPNAPLGASHSPMPFALSGISFLAL